jgi:hypothetical protein
MDILGILANHRSPRPLIGALFGGTHGNRIMGRKNNDLWLAKAEAT